MIQDDPLGLVVDAVRPTGEDTSFTYAILGVVIWFFALELALTWAQDAGSVQTLMELLFINRPSWVWPVAPFLHRGPGHFLANVAFIYIASPVETRLTRLRYLALILLTGFVPLYADAVKLAVFGGEPHVAVYGSSAFAFGLLGYGLTSQIGGAWDLTPRWWLIVLCSVLATLLVVINMAEALTNPITLHLGHLGGLVVGVVVSTLE